MYNDTLQIPFALEKKIYSYSRTLKLKYQMNLKFAIRENRPVSANLYRQLIGQLERVLECEKAGYHIDLLFWSVEGSKE